MIERIDHICVVVENIDKARQVLLEIGCPFLWDGPFGDIWVSGFSIGAVNLELVSMDVLQTARKMFGIDQIAFDPGELTTTLKALRRAGFNPSEAVEGEFHCDISGVHTDWRWRTADVDRDKHLPGLPCFLCEYYAPYQHYGKSVPSSPLRFVELEVALPEPQAAVPIYERALNVQSTVAENGYLLPVGDTLIRLVQGDGVSLVLQPLVTGLPLQKISAVIPGIGWQEGP